MRRLCAPSDSGFSLMEIIIVLAIVSITVAMSSNVMSSGRSRFAVENDKLRDVLSRARDKAILKGACVAVEVTAAEIRTTTYFVSGPCSPPLGSPAEVTTQSFSSIVALESSPSREFVFNKQGGTGLNAPVIVNMTGSDARVSYLVYPATGQLELR